MATRKNTKKSVQTGAKKTPAGQSKVKSNSKVNKQAYTREELEKYEDMIAVKKTIIIFVSGVVALFCYVAFFGLTGKASAIIGGLFFGLFGWVAWLIPALCVIAIGIYLVNPHNKRVRKKIISTSIASWMLMGLTDLATNAKTLSVYYNLAKQDTSGFANCVHKALETTLLKGKASGGIFGSILNDTLDAFMGAIGSGIVMTATLLIALFVFGGEEFLASVRQRNKRNRDLNDAYIEYQQSEEYQKPSYQLPKRNKRRKIQSNRNMQAVDLTQMNEQLDRTEKDKLKKQKEEKKNKQLEENKKKSTPNGMKEIISSSQEKSPAKVPTSVVTKPQDAAKVNTAEPVGVEEPAIPIYREEMNQKFGNKNTSKNKLVDAKKPQTVADKKAKPEKNTNKDVETSTRPVVKDTKATKPYVFPSIDLLSVPQNVEGRVSDDELRDTAMKLQDTLQSFGVNVTMGAVTCGPTVTRFELQPEQGVRVNKITNLADDLKLSLAAASIRIEAPIPGKSAVGIEVPNPSASPVFFRELLEGNDFKNAKSPVTFAVGKDIAGKLILTDIAKMPHLLIAGATGSGKSVCINTLIMSILYKADPSDVKLIMIDPKVVELSVYNGIPHLFCPVVTDPKEAAASLNWAVREMMERYNKFKDLGVRNISGYNQKIKTVPEDKAKELGYEKMPSLVIIVDEFADLMMVASKEVEDAVCRLAQLARAAGIHLVLATQRPSVNVITGVIKANIPSRIAFSVSSAIDSRTILDKAGAEKLIGKGDMLFFPSGYSEPVRVQGAFVSDNEVSDVVEYLKEQNEQPEYNEAVTELPPEPVEKSESPKQKAKPENDEYFEDAGRFVIESERAAAGQLQRRFQIGFNRAGRIIDQLHKAGVVGPAEGTKPRKILMTKEEFETYLLQSQGDDNETSEAAVSEEASIDDVQNDAMDMIMQMENEIVASEENADESIDSLE